MSCILDARGRLWKKERGIWNFYMNGTLMVERIVKKKYIEF